MPPIDCNLGTDCFVQQYVDRDPTDGARDFRCQSLSYDGHKGTDFALRSRAQMEQGVDVVAAASGTVRAIRDGMADQLVTSENRAALAGRDCGNGLVIDHADGWSTQYCHFKRGSVQVRSGDKVTSGDVLGQVGLSGRTQFPHVHITVRKDDAVIDPFDPTGTSTCAVPSAETLWQTPIAYQPGGVIATGFADAVPEYDTIKAGQAHRAELPADAPALVVFGYIFGARAGDTLHLRITGPDGEVIDRAVDLDRTQAQLFRAIGKRRRDAHWPVGIYEGTATLIRRAEIIGTQRNVVEIR
ncbi:M23 family metallopeptidase [uncultured Tateyamaria sp.]|uniref:M23 family metallopeptidase n=1 Tax=uncultured Tateyamaria sp. TaxID=455651 RepID=UPI0034508916